MTDNPRPTEKASDIERLLRSLRWRIRAYVWIEGIALAIVWLGVTFWAGLLADYLPVMLGASEMPLGARTALLLAITTVSAVIFYRWVLRRAFVRLGGRSMALLLERRFPHFHDSLLTVVEMAEQPGHADPFSGAMLDSTSHEAISQLPEVQLHKVFNFAPLARNVAGALAVLVSVAAFGIFASDAFACWVGRLYLLSEETWPRKTRIEVLDLTDGAIKVARGSDFAVRVRADATLHVPEACTIHYRTDDGDRGRVPMRRVGSVRGDFDGHFYQYYVFDGKPFKGILSGVRFDVVGYDHRVSGQRVEVVDSPDVVEVQLDCVLPKYTGLLPRVENWTVGKTLFFGTRVTVLARSGKPLAGVEIRSSIPGAPTRARLIAEPGQESPTRFEYPLGTLTEPVTLDVTLLDTDGVAGRKPYRITIGVKEDEPPAVDVVLRGIGTAITPDARLPVAGTVIDDLEVARTWFALEAAESESRDFPIALGAGGVVDAALDLRTQRTRDDGRQFELEPGTTAALTVRSADKFDLADEPNIGVSDRYQLDVVTPGELLIRLEARELGLRRRFEQIIDEMRQSRDTLLRVRTYEDAGDNAGAEPEDTLGPDASAGDSAAGDSVTGDSVTGDSAAGAEPDDEAGAAESARRRARSLRLLRVQRANQHARRAAQEVLGVAASFDDIREELINNRIDSAERRARLKQQIAAPLREIGEEMFPELERRLETLEANIDDPEKGSEASGRAIEQAGLILVRMEEILQKMLEVETFNELIDIVRDLIRQQEKLGDETKEEQKRQVLDLLR